MIWLLYLLAAGLVGWLLVVAFDALNERSMHELADAALWGLATLLVLAAAEVARNSRRGGNR